MTYAYKNNMLRTHCIFQIIWQYFKCDKYIKIQQNNRKWCDNFYLELIMYYFSQIDAILILSHPKYTRNFLL